MAVPGDKDLNQVGKPDDTCGKQQELCKAFQVMIGDIGLQPERIAHRYEKKDDHGEAGMNSSGDKIRRKDRAVPSGHKAHGEIP